MFDYYTSVIIPLTALFPLITALLWFRDTGTHGKVLFWFVLISAVINQVAIYVSHYSTNTLYFYHGYAVVEFTMLSAFYSCFFITRYKKLIWFIVLLFVIACIINIIYFQHKEEYNSYTRTLGALIIVIYSLLLSYRHFNLSQGSWASSGINWFNTGILLYYASSAIMFAFFNYIIRMPLPIFDAIWGTHCALLAIEYTFFAIGYYKQHAANAR